MAAVADSAIDFMSFVLAQSEGVEKCASGAQFRGSRGDYLIPSFPAFDKSESHGCTKTCNSMLHGVGFVLSFDWASGCHAGSRMRNVAPRAVIDSTAIPSPS